MFKHLDLLRAVSVFSLLAFASCASNEPCSTIQKQQDGHSYMVTVRDGEIFKYSETSKRMDELKRSVSVTAKEICKSDEFRLFQCRVKPSSHKGRCYFVCEAPNQPAPMPPPPVKPIIDPGEDPN